MANKKDAVFVFIDESIGGRVLVLAGVACRLCNIEKVASVVDNIKGELGLDELKWQKQKKKGKTRQKREKVVKDFKTKLEKNLWIFGSACYDARNKKQLKPAQLYVPAFRHLLQRVGSKIYKEFTSPDSRPMVFVVCDRPPEADRKNEQLSKYIRVGSGAPEEEYTANYKKITLLVPDKVTTSLKELGFAPFVCYSHAKYNPVLQIADFIAGAIQTFINQEIRYVKKEIEEKQCWAREYVRDLKIEKVSLALHAFSDQKIKDHINNLLSSKNVKCLPNDFDPLQADMGI